MTKGVEELEAKESHRNIGCLGCFRLPTIPGRVDFTSFLHRVNRDLICRLYYLVSIEERR